MSDFPLPRDADESPADSAADASVVPDPLYEAIVVTCADGDECTIYPADASEAEVVTRWVSAGPGSFVSLAKMR